MDGQIHHLPNFVAMSQTIADIAVYQFSRWRPSAIFNFCMRFDYQKGYLVVLIVVQNLVGIGAAVSIIC